MFSAIWTGLQLIASPVTEMVKGWQTRKQVKLASDVAIQKAKTVGMIERLKTGQAADIAWEQTSIENSGWKDEWFTILLSIPAILCFIPGMADYVRAGFAALATCPEWYKWAFSIAVASSFGFKKFANVMALKKGA